jgi:ABC-type multidrug transport system fused ATPase/permease subunit
VSEAKTKPGFGSAGFWQFLQPQLRPYTKPLAVALALNSLHGAAISLQTLTPKYLLDDVLLKKDLTGHQRFLHLSVLLAIYLFTSVFIRMGAWHLGYRIFARIREKVIIAMRARFFRHINSLCLRFHHNNNSGELFSYIFGSPLGQIQTFLHNLALFGPGSTFTLLTSLIWAGVWDIPMTSLLAVSVFATVIVLNHSRKRMRDLHSDYQKAETQVSGRVADLIRGAREIKLYGVEQSICNDFENEAVAISQKVIVRDIQAHIQWMKQETVGYIFFAMLCALGAYRFLYCGLTPGELLAYLTSFIALQSPLQQIFNIAALGGAAEASFRRMNAVFETLSTTPDQAETIAMPDQGDIVFDDVNFRYTNKPVLQGVSFTIPYGQRVAFVGPSGAGKTTISQLILRLYDPVSGVISIGGAPLRAVVGTELRKRFGVVPQSPYFFQTTIRKNLLLVRPNATDEMIRNVCMAANAWEFIEQLPEGLETAVGEAGSTLSGGQRQRIAIARALLIEPSFFIFDEATSALDTVSERLIQDSINKSLKGRTAIFIAHRLATIKSCDRIIVLRDGKVEQDGSFATLGAEEGLFRDMIRADVFSAQSEE